MIIKGSLLFWNTIIPSSSQGGRSEDRKSEI